MIMLDIWKLQIAFQKQFIIPGVMKVNCVTYYNTISFRIILLHDLLGIKCCTF